MSPEESALFRKFQDGELTANEFWDLKEEVLVHQKKQAELDEKEAFARTVNDAIVNAGGTLPKLAYGDFHNPFAQPQNLTNIMALIRHGSPSLIAFLKEQAGVVANSFDFQYNQQKQASESAIAAQHQRIIEQTEKFKAANRSNQKGYNSGNIGNYS